MGLFKSLFNRKTGRQQPQYNNFVGEVEGILTCIGQNFDNSRPAIEGSLQMLDYLGNLDRQTLLKAIATHLLHYTDPFLNPLEDFQFVLSRPYNYQTLIVKGAAVACIYLDASELVRVISKAMSLHSQQSEYLGVALNWLLRRQSAWNHQNFLPFKCLQS